MAITIQVTRGLTSACMKKTSTNAAWQMAIATPAIRWPSGPSSKKELPDYRRHDTQHTNADERPSDATYDRFVYLMEVLKECRYDARRIAERCPFLVEDVAFNSILCESERCLGKIAVIVGERADIHRSRSEATRLGLDDLWNNDEGNHESFDLAGDCRIDRHVASGFLPLICEAGDRRRAEQSIEALHSKHYGGNGRNTYPVSMFDREQPGYTSKNYWRGPVWVNINWLLARGARRSGREDFADELEEAVLQLTGKSGFREHYACESGEGDGEKASPGRRRWQSN